MWRLAILCGLCLLMSGAAASGAPFSSSSPSDSVMYQASTTSLVAHRRTVKRTHGLHAANVMLLGNQAIESTVGHNLVGTVEAFAFRARRSGTAASISVYLGARDRATTLFAGLYSSRHGHPQSLLTSALRRSAKAGAWNSLAVASARVKSGRKYWLAVLGKGGAIYFRDQSGGLCAGMRSSRRKMRLLPRTWPAGPNSHACRISAYLKGAARGTGGGMTAPGGPTTTSPGTTPTSSNAPVNTVQPYFVTSTVSNTTGACTAGCAIEGQQLSVTPGMWSHNATFSYQWQDCITRAGTDTRVAVATGGASDIMTPPTTSSCVNAAGPGATTSTYTVNANDVGYALAVNVTATNSSGSVSTTPTGSCDTGLMTTTWNASTNPGAPIASTYPDNGEPGCSPVSAVVGISQYGTGTAGEHFCTNAPITCGFADIANSGVPPGTALYAVPGTCTSPSGPGAGCGATGSGWSYSGGHITLSGGAVLRNVRYVGTNGSITISGSTSDVTIQDSDLSESCNCNFQTAGGIITLSGSGGNMTIEHNNLHGLDASTAGDGCNAAVFAGGSTGTNITVTNNDIYFCATGLNQIKATNGGWTIIDNYIHDFAWGDSARSNHFDGIQFEGGGSASSLTNFVNNTVLCDVDQTDAVILSTDFSPPANSYRWIVHNLVGGGDASIYAGSSTSYPTTNSTFATNVFSQIYMGDHNIRSQYGGGSFGPIAYWTPSTNTWTSNVWDDTGGAVPPSTQT